jgi:anthranilate phosphoribosyltransferase
MKYVAPVRRELIQKTFFNMLGPLVNPSFPQNQSVGVYNLEVARIYSFLLQKSGKNFSIIHSLDGYDEISLTGDVKIISNKSEEVLSPEYFGFNKLQAEQISGGTDVKSSAKIFLNVLENKATTEQKNVILANSAVAIKTINPKLSISDAIEEAKQSIESGSALKSLKIFLNK